MAKKLVWTETAKNQRREILEYWIKRNGNKKCTGNSVALAI